LVSSAVISNSLSSTAINNLYYWERSRDSSAVYGLDDRGFESRQDLGIFLFTTASRLALGPTQPRIQWIPGALSLGVMRPGRETYHSPPYCAEIKECVELYLHSSNTHSWCGAQLKAPEQLYLSLLLLKRHKYLTLALEKWSDTSFTVALKHELHPHHKYQPF
jgi:hypothetical protein